MVSDSIEKIILDIKKRARDYHSEFSIVDYIECKGIRYVILPYVKELEAKLKQRDELLLKIIDAKGINEIFFTTEETSIIDDVGYGRGWDNA